mgnify:CR=1 FL=1
MATTNYGVNSQETVKLWSRKLFREALKRTWAYKFIGSDSNSVCQIAEDTSKGSGDRVRVTLRMLLTGDGISGDGTLEGSEEALTTYTDNVVVDQLRHAVRSGGKMTEQRIPFSVREEARMGLTDWWADRIDTWFMNQLGGSLGDIRTTGMQAATNPAGTNRHLLGDLGTGLTTEVQVGSASASNIMTLQRIDSCVLVAKTSTPQIRPVRIGGEDKFCMFLHPYQVRDLRVNTNTGQWLDIQKAAMQGGQVSNNPIYTGALGEYNGVVLHESTRVPFGGSATGSVQSNNCRAIFVGAQAACMGFGRGFGTNRMSWVEELFDYRNQLGVSAGLIGGLKKTVFNSSDFGSIILSTSVSGSN